MFRQLIFSKQYSLSIILMVLPCPQAHAWCCEHGHLKGIPTWIKLSYNFMHVASSTPFKVIHHRVWNLLTWLVLPSHIPAQNINTPLLLTYLQSKLKERLYFRVYLPLLMCLRSHLLGLPTGLALVVFSAMLSLCLVCLLGLLC